MTDVTTITTVLTALKTATEVAKFLRESDASFQEAETKLRIADLISGLADARIALSEVQEEIHEKDKEIKRLNDAMKLKKELVRHRDAYYEQDEGGNPGGDPYCSYCFEVNHLVVHINDIPHMSISTCPECKNTFARQPKFDPIK